MIHNGTRCRHGRIFLTKGTAAIHNDIGTVIAPGIEVAIVEGHIIGDVGDFGRCGDCRAMVEISQQDGLVT